jgi:hypothetical protein
VGRFLNIVAGSILRFVGLLCAWLQWAVGSMPLCVGVWYVSGDRQKPFLWSHFAVKMISALLCTVSLCLLKFTSYPALHSWPTGSRLVLRSWNTCALLACSFRLGRFSLEVLHNCIVSLFGIHTVMGGFLSLVML